MKTYGLDIKRELLEQSDKDYVFGSRRLPSLVNIPVGQRKKYLPRGENQNKGADKMSCASHSPCNAWEIGFNYLLIENKLSFNNFKWLDDNGYITENGIEFSDAFLAILSGTTRKGNSLKAPLNLAYKKGLIPKSTLPQLESWESHYDRRRIKPEMLDLGLEFLKHFPINYEKVYLKDFAKLEDVLCVGGYAWELNSRGEYGRVDYDPNHAFLIFEPEYFAFDSYQDDKDFIKDLTPDYKFLPYGYRVTINTKKVKQLNWLQRFLRRFYA